LKQKKLNVHYVIETHVHADHLTGAGWLKQRLGCNSVISSRVKGVQETFAQHLDMPTLKCDGSQFDKLVEDGEKFTAGSLVIECIATPGHTPACTCFKIGGLLFTGDALFMPDFGTGRCDFPNGSADDLYTSIHDKLYALPDETRVFVGHDYQPGGRALKYETTIRACKAQNKQLTAVTAREEFVAWRRTRDAGLAPPKLLYQSLQVNLNNGVLPSKGANGTRYMIIPLNGLKNTDEVGQ
jgi:glyoxylase-like metal-dependent hydrolase (beta-lactamase superfamily II)